MSFDVFESSGLTDIYVTNGGGKRSGLAPTDGVATKVLIQLHFKFNLKFYTFN